MSHEIKRGRLFTLARRAEPDDHEAQVQALKELQKQPGFIVRKPASKKKDSWLFTAFKKKWVRIMRLLFRNKQKPVLTSQTKGADSSPSRGKNMPKRR